MRYIGVKESTFKISFKMTEELININPMFKPIQDFILEKDTNGDKSCVLDWLEHGVDVNKFFRHFKGNFKGRLFDSNIPHK
jgi:hypothetical protein